MDCQCAYCGGTDASIIGANNVTYSSEFLAAKAGADKKKSSIGSGNLSIDV